LGLSHILSIYVRLVTLNFKSLLKLNRQKLHNQTKNMTQILKILTNRETDLERRRTRYLATGNWVKVIQTEAKQEELDLLKKAIVDFPALVNKALTVDQVTPYI